jgi:hypothetical protein
MKCHGLNFCLFKDIKRTYKAYIMSIFMQACCKSIALIGLFVINEMAVNEMITCNSYFSLICPSTEFLWANEALLACGVAAGIGYITFLVILIYKVKAFNSYNLPAVVVIPQQQPQFGSNPAYYGAQPPQMANLEMPIATPVVLNTSQQANASTGNFYNSNLTYKS